MHAIGLGVPWQAVEHVDHFRYYFNITEYIFFIKRINMSYRGIIIPYINEILRSIYLAYIELIFE